MDLSDESDTETDLPEPLTSVYRQFRGLPHNIIREKSHEVLDKVKRTLNTDWCENLPYYEGEVNMEGLAHAHREGRITSTNIYHFWRSYRQHQQQDRSPSSSRHSLGDRKEDAARKCSADETSKGRIHFYATCQITAKKICATCRANFQYKCV